MKNKNKTTRPAEFRRSRITTSRPQREADHLTPRPPHHDLLVLSFYPGMGSIAAPTGHSTAA